MENVMLTEDQFAVICGLVQTSEDVNADGIFPKAGVWESLREDFPIEKFHLAVHLGIISYDKEAGT